MNVIDIEKLAARLRDAADAVTAEASETTELVETESLDEVGTKSRDAVQVHGRVTLSSLFQHPDTHPLVLDLALLKKYGPDFLLWEPETLEHRIPQDFKVREITELNMTKVQACRTLHLVDTYWERWEVFSWVTAVMNGHFPDFENMQVPTLSQAAVGVYNAKRIRDDVDWSSEVTTFLSQVFRFEGVFLAIDPLDFVPIQDDGYVITSDEVRKAWLALGAASISTEETILNEQLRRLRVIQEALDTNRAFLRAQLPLVNHV